MTMKARTAALMLIGVILFVALGCKEKEPPPEHHKFTRPKLPETGIRK